VKLSLIHVAVIAVAYTGLLFLIAWFAGKRRDAGKSLVN